MPLHWLHDAIPVAFDTGFKRYGYITACMKKSFYLIVILMLYSCVAACAEIAIHMTPPKKAKISHNALTNQAEKQFWQTLHRGDYQNISSTEKLLTAAYLENPDDPRLAAHLGFLHIWKIAERRRSSTQDPLIVNQIILARKFFADAVALNPKDARYLGFLGAATLIEGKIFDDQRQQTKGYFILKDAIAEWPQFNLFTGGYVMSVLPADSKKYQQALAWQWQTLDLCAQTKINRDNPDFSPYMKVENHQGQQRACWNSWIAPYNFEGFFLNMGDMLVKAGDWRTGIKIYNNAKLAHNYSAWPYKSVLQQRIKNAKNNVAIFNHVARENDAPVIMFESRYSCMACHQAQ